MIYREGALQTGEQGQGVVGDVCIVGLALLGLSNEDREQDDGDDEQSEADIVHVLPLHLRAEDESCEDVGAGHGDNLPRGPNTHGETAFLDGEPHGDDRRRDDADNADAEALDDAAEQQNSLVRRKKANESSYHRSGDGREAHVARAELTDDARGGQGQDDAQDAGHGGDPARSLCGDAKLLHQDGNNRHDLVLPPCDGDANDEDRDKDNPGFLHVLLRLLHGSLFGNTHTRSLLPFLAFL